MSMRNRQDHSEPRAYRYYVFVDAERGRGFDDEADALMYFDEEVLLAQMSANQENATYTVSVQDELSSGKDAIVAMFICTPEPKELPKLRPVFDRAVHTSMRKMNADKKERA